jgi:uncharacterized protein (DUF885 family)
MPIMRVVMGACALMLLFACSGESPAGGVAVAAEQQSSAQAEFAQSETERLNAWFEQIDREDLDRSPTSKASRGIIDDDYSEWDDPSDTFAIETFEIGEARLAYMRDNFDYDALDPSAQLSWRLFEYRRENNRRNFPFRRHNYVFTQMRGEHANIPVFLTNVHRVESVATAEDWIARAGGVGEYLDGHIEEARQRYALGVHPPRWVYDHVIDTARNIISGAPFDDGDDDAVVWASFVERVNALEADEATKSRLINQGRQALTETWVPTYERLIAVMTEHREGAGDDAGVWRLPDGREYYDTRLAHFTTTDLSARAVHELGLANVERIHAEMHAIKDEVGFDGSLQEFFEFMRNDPQFYFPNTDEGREAYLSQAREIIETMNERLPEYFISLPRHELEVRRVEAFRERSAGKAFYSRPAPDGSRPGIYYANLYDMNDMPIYQMEALAYHEANPGHHLQISIMLDLENIPPFRRFSGYTAYSEGWGLYSEYLPLEMGFYEDPYSNFGRLAMELWRAARLVVDTGLHNKEWTREQAIDYLVTNTPNPRGDAVRAIERYIVMPGQATAYMIGQIKILEARERARARLGEDFDIRQFHEVVLRDGAVPLTVLDELVDDWVDRTLAEQGEALAGH